MTGARVVGWALIVAAVAGAFFVGRGSMSTAALEATRDSLAQARVKKVDTVTKYVAIAAASKAKSDESKGVSDVADQLVAIANDTTLHVRVTPSAPPTAVIVPIQVVADLTKLRKTVADQAVTILDQRAAMSRQDDLIRHDSVQFHLDEQIIAKLKSQQCGRDCKLLIFTGGFLAARLLR